MSNNPDIQDLAVQDSAAGPEPPNTEGQKQAVVMPEDELDAEESNARAEQLEIHTANMKITNSEHEKTLELVQDLIETISQRD